MGTLGLCERCKVLPVTNKEHPKICDACYGFIQLYAGKKEVEE